MLFENGFIKPDKLEILSENHRQTDLLDWSKEIEKFHNRLKLIKRNSVIGFMGKFGTGKTTFLNQLIHKEDVNTKWIEFNAWKYPERANLRENFVLECARSLDEDTFDKVLLEIDGAQGKNKKKLIELGGELISQITQIKALDGIKHFGHFFDTTPAKRTFQVQNILKNLLGEIDHPFINIIIEDIDRSGDEGVYFLETLYHFINNEIIPKSIIKVIVPIGNDKYHIHLDQYGKCLDILYQFSPTEINFNQFVKELFVEEISQSKHLFGQTCSLFELIFKNYHEQISIRKLKKVIIAANHLYILLSQDYGAVIDFRICLMIELSKILFVSDDLNNRFTLYNKFYSAKLVREKIFEALIYCIYQENHRVRGQLLSSLTAEKYNAVSENYQDELHKLKLNIRIEDRAWNKGDQSDSDPVRLFTKTFPDAHQEDSRVGISNVYFRY